MICSRSGSDCDSFLEEVWQKDSDRIWLIIVARDLDRIWLLKKGIEQDFDFALSIGRNALFLLFCTLSCITWIKNSDRSYGLNFSTLLIFCK